MTVELKLRVCPFCGNWVKERARRCRHCKRWIHRLRTANLNFDLDFIQLNLGQESYWDATLICPKCQHGNSAKATKCQRCGRTFYITPAEGPSGWTKAWETVRNFVNGSDRECPYCAEDIPQSAQVCPHCNIQFTS